MVSTVVKPTGREGSRATTATRLALVLEYDGAAYRGFQLQAGALTIQGELERAILALTGERLRVTGAGRTDAGVHARGQVVSFATASRLEPATFVDGLNHYLPKDIAVRAARAVADSFSARRTARSREYRYTIVNCGTRSPLAERFAYRVEDSLDVAAMDRACRTIVGERDLASFASGIGGETMSTLRTVHSAFVSRDTAVTREGDLVTIDVVANAFLRHQMRSLAGCLVAIGRGRMALDQFCEVVAARQPGLAGPVLPAHGLCLIRVNYTHSLEDETR